MPESISKSGGAVPQGAKPFAPWTMRPLRSLMAAALAAMAFSGPALSEEPLADVSLHSPDECPSTGQLNATTLYWHLRGEERIFRDPEYAGVRMENGLREHYAPEEIRELETVTDRKTCVRLNEHYHGLYLIALDDREIDRQVPEVYSIYYKTDDHIIVVRKVYSPGEPDLDTVGPPSGGSTGVTVYDHELHRISTFGL